MPASLQVVEDWSKRCEQAREEILHTVEKYHTRLDTPPAIMFHGSVQNILYQSNKECTCKRGQNNVEKLSGGCPL